MAQCHIDTLLQKLSSQASIRAAGTSFPCWCCMVDPACPGEKHTLLPH